MSVILAQAQVSARQRELSQAVARQARVRLLVDIQGVGESYLRGGSAITFPTFMLDEPTFSFGVSAIGVVRDGELPLATAIVLAYKKTHQGLYVAADMGFHVESARSDIRLRFSLTFEGTAVRTTHGLSGV